jgi:hypothetical protein
LNQTSPRENKVRQSDRVGYRSTNPNFKFNKSNLKYNSKYELYAIDQETVLD